ncbi:MAG TPA: hypothetical protein PKC72_00890 [Chitinophagaceae bacterium]|nr:hypothetical protein [Chitinophagaceae bacterium]
MKSLLIAALITISVAIIFGFRHQTNGTDHLADKTWVIAPRFLFLKEGVSKDEARKWLENEYLPLYRQFPGFNAMIGDPVKSAKWGSKDSTDKEKDFVVIYFFDSKETYDRYFPKEGFGVEIVEGIKKHQSTIDKLFGKYFIQERYQFEDYLMFASSK